MVGMAMELAEVVTEAVVPVVAGGVKVVLHMAMDMALVRMSHVHIITRLHMIINITAIFGNFSQKEGFAILKRGVPGGPIINQYASGKVPYANCSLVANLIDQPFYCVC